MRKTWKIAILSGVLLAGIGGTASADSRVQFSIGLGLPAPVVYSPYYSAPDYYPAPRPVYAPPPEAYYPAPDVYYTPPAYYYSPPAYYPPARVVYGSYPYWRSHHHHHWR